MAKRATKASIPTKACIECKEVKVETDYRLQKGKRANKCTKCISNATTARIAALPTKSSKVCNKCAKNRPISDYWKVNGVYRTICIPCINIRRTELRNKAKTKVHEPGATKVCLKCGKTKMVNKFRIYSSLAGLYSSCRDCEKIEQTVFVKFKECTNCEVEQAAEEFDENLHNKDHLHSHCRICRRYRVADRVADMDNLRLQLKINAGKCSNPECKNVLLHPMFLEFAHWQRGTKPRSESGLRRNWSDLTREKMILDEFKLGRFLCMICHAY